jgi:hypothetical protein
MIRIRIVSNRIGRISRSRIRKPAILLHPRMADR